jgi:hypothetical protein
MRKDFELLTALTPRLTWGMLHILMGFSVKTEDTPGTGAKGFYLLPNVHGVRDDGTHFNGIAIKRRHGTVISWDGRVVKHCTTVPIPGGNNYAYGTFTAAKERIVGVGHENPSCWIIVQPVLLLPMTVLMHPVESVNVGNEDSNKLVRRSECIGGYCDTRTVCPVVGIFFDYSTVY